MSAPPFQAAILPVTPYRQNCALLWCAKTMRGAILDPGGETERLVDAAAEAGVTIEKIFLTHGHHDHAAGANALKRATGAVIEGPHEEDTFLLSALGEMRHIRGFEAAEACAPDRFLNEGDAVSFGEVRFEVLHCPGHTPGHVVFFHREAALAFVGDVLFKGSVGRTDFPRGDSATLIDSIRRKLWPLGDDVRFLPGHGPMSSFGEERRTNPYVGDRA